MAGHGLATSLATVASSPVPLTPDLLFYIRIPTMFGVLVNIDSKKFGDQAHPLMSLCPLPYLWVSCFPVAKVFLLKL